MKEILGFKEINIIVPKYEYLTLMTCFDECHRVEDAGDNELLASYSAELNSCHDVVMNVYNAPTEEGGPWIDPMVLRKCENFWAEVMVGDILESFDSSISFIVDGVEYDIAFKMGE